MRYVSLLFAGLTLAVLCAGCLSSAPPPATTWVLEDAVIRALPGAEPKPLFVATRLGSVTVQAPYDRPAFAVKRKDGSVVFDPANHFAAAPAALLKGPLLAGLAGDGRFGHVVPASSVVSADAIAEVIVSELVLDCRAEGTPKARAELAVNIVANGNTRKVVLTGRGAAEVDVAAGDYGAAFSAAVNNALSNALVELK